MPQALATAFMLKPSAWSAAFNIIKGLTLAENAGVSNYRGSVSLVKYAVRVLERRDPVQAMEVAAWIVDHSGNIYILFEMRKIRHAFEEIIRTAVSWEECLQRLNGWGSEESHRQSEAVRESAERELQATIRAAVRARCHAERQQLSAARAMVRQSFLHELSLLDPKVRLEHLAWDEKRDLSYYPDSFAIVPTESFARLDLETQARLLAKLQNRPKGAWRGLHRRLTEVGK